MSARFLTLADAIAEHVQDGACVALEGFTHLIPFAAGHEIIRQRRHDLHLVRMTPDLVYDQMIGAGCARKLDFSWAGNPGVGSLHRFRDAVEHGLLRNVFVEAGAPSSPASRSGCAISIHSSVYSSQRLAVIRLVLFAPATLAACSRPPASNDPSWPFVSFGMKR